MTKSVKDSYFSLPRETNTGFPPFKLPGNNTHPGIWQRSPTSWGQTFASRHWRQSRNVSPNAYAKPGSEPERMMEEDADVSKRRVGLWRSDWVLVVSVGFTKQYYTITYAFIDLISLFNHISAKKTSHERARHTWHDDAFYTQSKIKLMYIK